MKIFADYHTHTRFSHGTGTVLENISAAASKGLREVAVTDHGPATLWGVGVKNAEALLEVKELVDRARESVPDILGLSGVEANIIDLDGGLDVPKDILKQLDVVMAGFHPNIKGRTIKDSISLNSRMIAGKWFPAWARSNRVENTKIMVEAVMKNDIDIISHPGHNIDIDTAELARACAKRETALEINCGHRNTSLGFLRVAAAEGVKFVINSDAHEPGEVGECEYGLMLAEAAGLSIEDIINVE